MTPQERTVSLVERYGECCKYKTAATIINKSERTIKRMLEDGRLTGACQGSMVDMYSIASYLLNPKQADFQANRCRQRRLEKR